MLENKLDDAITIKMIERRHTKIFFDFIERNREHLINWIPSISKINEYNDIDQYINSYLEKYIKGLGFLFGLWERNTIIGVILAREIDNDAKWAEIGYMIDANYQGKGIIKKACKKLIKYLFDELKMEKIEICCDEKNISSRGLAEKLGFSVEGNIRNHMVINNGSSLKRVGKNS
jgi:ribosomal-protein-serine acetyltransferase